MRVGITGAGGFVGSAVTTALRRRGHEVFALARRPATAQLAGLHAIVHLAGERVDGRWSSKKKQEIFDSRVLGTRHLVGALGALEAKPRVLVCASATGYYGDRGDSLLDEDSRPGSDFLAGVCVAWEREANAAAAHGMRVVTVRCGVVLGRGGALDTLLPVFHAGAGGPLGSGRQWFPWIHIDDIAALYCDAVERGDIEGAIAGVSPDVATNGRVAHGLASVLHRPSVLAVPPPALRLVLGEFGQTLLGGQLLLPRRTMAFGFRWQHERLEAALVDAVGALHGWTNPLRTVVSEQFVKARAQDAFAFFADPRNLPRLAPPSMRISKVTAPPVLKPGDTFDFRLRFGIVPIPWRALVLELAAPKRFVDVQVRGPHQWWRHEHDIEDGDGGVVVRERVEFELPFAPLSEIAAEKVRRGIEGVFAYRRRAMEEIFAG